jgi:hypothetical protein
MVDFSASYTYSVTTDDARMTPQGWPVVLRERPDATGRDPAWLDGTSDLDVPHRIVLTALFPVPGTPLRLGAV